MSNCKYRHSFPQTDEDDYEYANGSLVFSDKTIRMTFIRKVYAILTTQMAIVGLIILCLFNVPGGQQFAVVNSYLTYIAFGAAIIILLALACCESVARTTPINYILLFIFTIAQGVSLGVISCGIGVDQVLIAVGLTALICLSLTFFTFQTKAKLTTLVEVLLTTLFIFLVVGITSLLVSEIELIHVFYGCAGALIFSLHLVVDTEFMIRGNHKYSFSPEEYIFAVLAIYLDIVNIFVNILLELIDL